MYNFPLFLSSGPSWNAVFGGFAESPGFRGVNFAPCGAIMHSTLLYSTLLYSKADGDTVFRPQTALFYFYQRKAVRN